MEEVFRAQFFFAHSQFVTVGKKLANHAAVFFQPVGPRVLLEYFLFFVKVPVVPNSGSGNGALSFLLGDPDRNWWEITSPAA